MKSIYFCLIAGFALIVGTFAHPSTLDLVSSSPSQIQVKLEMVGDTEVKISITNTGPETLRLVKLDSLLSSLDLNKITVTQSGKKFDSQ
jgi:deuterolysin